MSEPVNPGSTSPLIRKKAVSLQFRSGNVNTPLQLFHEPPLSVEYRAFAISAGSTSETTTSEALPGPLFAIRSKYSTGIPATTADGTDSKTCKSEMYKTVAEAVATLFEYVLSGVLLVTETVLLTTSPLAVLPSNVPLMRTTTLSAAASVPIAYDELKLFHVAPLLMLKERLSKPEGMLSVSKTEFALLGPLFFTL